MREYDLEEIKREIVEERSLTIKTNNLISALSADLKSIAKRQQTAERRMLLNSGVTYVVTIGIVLVLSKVALDAQVDAVRTESQNTASRVRELEAELASVSEREERRQVATTEAAALYGILKSGQKRELLQKLPTVLALDLSPAERQMFEESGRKARRDLSVESYHTGIEHMRAGRYHEATQSLREAIELEPDAPNTAEAEYQLARAYRSLDKQKNAVFILLKLTEASSNVDVLDEATYLLAECQVELELYNDAKATLRSFAKRFPSSPLKNDATSLLAELNLTH